VSATAPAGKGGPAGTEGALGAETLRAFQRRIDAIYGARDAARGVDRTFVWFVEEVGELARALLRGEEANLREEFADVLAWLATLASLAGVDLETAARKYAAGCPRCRSTPCACTHRSS
jgi:NTP pyrophosphatase (non-canonical NTP hydrolase)